MDKTVAYGIIAIFFISLVYVIWVVFTNVFYEPNEGLVEILDDQAQKDMDGVFLTNWNNQKSNTESTWGMTGIFLIGVLILIIIIVAFRNRRRSQQS